MADNAALFTAFEYHSPEKIRAALDAGADPSRIDGLIEMYSRSNRFAECLRTMLDAGAKIDDPLIECVLLDDAERLNTLLARSPELTRQRIGMRCTFTPLKGVTALHLAAEYNCTACLTALLEAGADVNAASTVDGHTPLFHTVNSSGNFALASMQLLLNAGARVDIQVPELIWGETFEWETQLFDQTPLSYTQCGLLPQFHRDEAQIYSNLAVLYEKKNGAPLQIRNVPNRYLRKS